MRRRLFRFTRRSARDLDADVDAELRFHLDMRAADLTAQRGLDAPAARAEALRQFGDVEDARRYMRAVDARHETAIRRREHMIDLRQDLAHAARGLRRSPGFAAVVVLALALGIGATTAIFTIVDAILLRPLPVPNAAQLVGFGDPALVGVTNTGAPRTDNFSYELYRTLRDRSRLVPELFASGYSSRLDVVVPEIGRATTDASGAPEQTRGRLVSGNYFSVLGVRAVAGRTLTAADDRAAGASLVAVISHDYWQRRFALDPATIGRTILVNRTPVTIVGVAAPGFLGEVVGRSSDLWMPLTMQPMLMPNQDWLRDRGVSWLLLMGRPQSGTSPARAAEELSMLARQAIVDGGGTVPDPRAIHVAAYDGKRGIPGVPAAASTGLMTLLGLAVLVLAVVSANVANLLLARVVARRSEISVRLAMGAGRARVVRQLLTESVLLGGMAGVLAVLIVAVGRAVLLRQLGSGAQPVPIDLPLDGRVLGFAAMLSLGTALVLGLVSAIHGTRLDLAASLRSRGRGTFGSAPGGGVRRLGFGQWLVVGQIALSLVLLAGAGLLVRTARNLADVDPGLSRDHLLVVSVDTHATGFDGDRLLVFERDLTARLRQIPGVQSATYSQNGLFSGIEAAANLQVAGFVPRAAEDTTAHTDQVGPNYFRTIGAHLLRGRDIEAHDDARAARVAVINETMARFYFARRDPIGQYLRIDTTHYAIVGVVGDVKHRSLRAEPTRQLYTAIEQSGGVGLVVFILRTAGDPARLVDVVRRTVLAANPSLQVRSARPLTELIYESVSPERIVGSLAGVAGGMALLLTALGLYGVMTYTIVRRTNEFGLRLALGAQPADVTRLVLRETLTLVGVGTALGMPAALGAARLLRHQLVGVGLVDPPTFAIALAVLATVAIVAGYRPASRASRASPQQALRES